MEIVLQAIQIATTFPNTHGQVVKQVVAASLWTCGRHFGLGDDPLQTFDGELAHVLNGIGASHDDIHASETAHGTYINHILLDSAIAKPGGHKMLDAMDGSRGNGRLLIGLRDAQVERGKAFIYTRNIDAGLQLCVVYRKTLYNFHCN